ncbi:MAG: CRTAC1 family protein, partial [Elusimicrobia bacterium]|nr:CRTAC1 family protein [Elusimicrobiota bacterium]
KDLVGPTVWHPDFLFLHREVLGLLAIAHMRTGKVSPCERMREDPACLLPKNVQDLPVDPKDAREAIRYLEATLEWKPLDLEAQWLLNLAHMAIGDYPQGVPKKWLIPPENFRGADFKRFPNLAPKLGVDVFAHAGGSIMDDFDGDGNLDLMTSASHLTEHMSYFHNNGDGTFSDWTERAGLKGVAGGIMIVQGDYDNDGHLDVLARVIGTGETAMLGLPGVYLLRNKGDGTFADVTKAAGLAKTKPGWAAVWGDYDNDGWLDFFIGNDDMAENPPALLHNNRDGTFSDVTKAVGIETSGFVRGAAWSDYDRSGRQSLFVSVNGPGNWGAAWGGFDQSGRMDLWRGKGNFLFRNEGPDRKGRWHFKDVAQRAGAKDPRMGFTAWFWDYDNDGWDDILVYDFHELNGSELAAADYLRVDYASSRPFLLRNRGDGTFADVSAETGLADHIVPAMGANFGDFDNDGWLDFYSATGDPDVRDFPPNRAFRSVGGRRFEDVTTAMGVGLLMKGHGVSIGDLDNDGSNELFVEMGGHELTDIAHSALFMNPGFGNDWVTLRLEGTRSNRSAMGARIKVRAATAEGPRDIYRTVSPGGSFGSNPLQQTIGLGRATAIESIEIRWPATGLVQKLAGPPPGRILKVREGAEGFELVPAQVVPFSRDPRW